MNEQYDVIVLGTGLKECITAGLLAKLGISKFNLIKTVKRFFNQIEMDTMDLTPQV